jgi:hypothetical protein
VAEERNLLLDPEAPAEAKRRYLHFYSSQRIRNLAGKRRGTSHSDLWQGLRLVMSKLQEGCPELALPALGSMLWSEEAVPWTGDAELHNEDLLKALLLLGYLRDGKHRFPVNWRTIGAEELGSVYESLLELHPRLEREAGTFKLASAAGHERKVTGSYYTPTSLVEALLDSALEPVLREAMKSEDPEQALLDLKVCDPAVGSGHFLLAAGRRIALRLASVRTGDEEASPEAVTHALRDVVGRCLYGVDLNPLAAELCKVSLWLEALEPGKPLSFLDHHIQVGNSLLGATPALLQEGIPDDAFKPIEGDDKKVVSEYKKVNREERKSQQLDFAEEMQPWDRLGDLAVSLARLDQLSDDDVASVQRKRAEYARLVKSAEYSSGKLWADAWCAAFVWRKVEDESVPRPLTERTFRQIERNPKAVRYGVVEEVRRLADQYRFFHWHLAFPDVFRVPERPLVGAKDPTGWEGGFDVVLGNPPWGAQVSQREKLLYKMRFEVAADRFDTFAAFVELGLNVTRSEGKFGFILPDIVLLKAYTTTRRLLLETVADLHIHAWGMAFRGVTMEAVSVTGRASPDVTQPIRVGISEEGGEIQDKAIPRHVFGRDKLLRFNLYYEEEKEVVREHLERVSTRFGNLYIAREGVHSGNSRKQLFLSRKEHDQCVPLIRSGGEVVPMEIQWAGNYLDLSVEKGDGRYFHLGKPDYFAPGTILIRRTGDSVIAAKNSEGGTQATTCSPVFAEKERIPTLTGW